MLPPEGVIDINELCDVIVRIIESLNVPSTVEIARLLRGNVVRIATPAHASTKNRVAFFESIGPSMKALVDCLTKSAETAIARASLVPPGRVFPIRWHAGTDHSITSYAALFGVSRLMTPEELRDSFFSKLPAFTVFNFYYLNESVADACLAAGTVTRAEADSCKAQAAILFAFCCYTSPPVLAPLPIVQPDSPSSSGPREHKDVISALEYGLLVGSCSDLPGIYNFTGRTREWIADVFARMVKTNMARLCLCGVLFFDIANFFVNSEDAVVTSDPANINPELPLARRDLLYIPDSGRMQAYDLPLGSKRDQLTSDTFDASLAVERDLIVARSQSGGSAIPRPERLIGNRKHLSFASVDIHQYSTGAVVNSEGATVPSRKPAGAASFQPIATQHVDTDPMSVDRAEATTTEEMEAADVSVVEARWGKWRRTPDNFRTLQDLDLMFDNMINATRGLINRTQQFFAPNVLRNWGIITGSDDTGSYRGSVWSERLLTETETISDSLNEQAAMLRHTIVGMIAQGSVTIPTAREQCPQFAYESARTSIERNFGLVSTFFRPGGPNIVPVDGVYGMTEERFREWTALLSQLRECVLYMYAFILVYVCVDPVPSMSAEWMVTPHEQEDFPAEELCTISGVASYKNMTARVHRLERAASAFMDIQYCVFVNAEGVVKTTAAPTPPTTTAAKKKPGARTPPPPRSAQI